MCVFFLSFSSLLFGVCSATNDMVFMNIFFFWNWCWSMRNGVPFTVVVEHERRLFSDLRHFFFQLKCVLYTFAYTYCDTKRKVFHIVIEREREFRSSINERRNEITYRARIGKGFLRISSKHIHIGIFLSFFLSFSLRATKLNHQAKIFWCFVRI